MRLITKSCAVIFFHSALLLVQSCPQRSGKSPSCCPGRMLAISVKTRKESKAFTSPAGFAASYTSLAYCNWKIFLQNLAKLLKMLN